MFFSTVIAAGLVLGLGAANGANRPLWTAAPPVVPRPTAPPASIAALSRAALPAVVGIFSTTAAAQDGADPFHDFLERIYGSGGPERDEPTHGIGTGFLIRDDGLVVTNSHVVEGATDLAVQVGNDERVLHATVLGRDEATDLALLRIEGPGPFPVLPLGDSDAVEVGEWVIAIGNPFGLLRSVTTGIVSFKGRRDVSPAGRPGYYDFLQTDAAINPGSSGGPLLDARGAVIAVNAAVNPAGHGIGFAVPVQMVKEIVPELFRVGRVARGWLGLAVQDQLSPELAASFGVPGGRGVLVTRVDAGGPAARGGLRAGDVVVAFGAQPIFDSYRLRWLTARAPVGRALRLAVWREGSQLDLEVTPLEKPPRGGHPPRDAQGAEKPFAAADGFGMRLEEVDPPGGPGEPRDPGARAGTLRLASLDVRGAAYRAGARVGDVLLEVNGSRVVHRKAAVSALRQPGPGGLVRLLVERGGEPLYFAVRLDGPQRAASPSVVR